MKSNQAGIGELVEGLLKRAGLEQKAKQFRVMLYWREIVGEANARHSRPRAIKNGILMVECSNAAWAQTLTLLRQQIMDKITARFGECPLQEIHFRGTGKKVEEAAEGAAQRPRPAEMELKREQQAWIEETAGGVEEPRLKARVEAALGSWMRQREWYEKSGRKRCARCGRMHGEEGELCAGCRE